MTRRAFRFGLGVSGNTGRPEFVERIRRAEASGFSVITGADHIGSHTAAVLPMLTVAAETAPQIRISPMVIANDYRHPVMLAKEAATMDILSEGRFELGIGTGWIRSHYEAAGIPYDSARTRVDRLEESIHVIKGCWSGEPFTSHGEHYDIEGVTCPKPTQQPNPPILVAGSGPRMLRLAGRAADIVGISPLTPGSRTFDGFGSDLATSGDRIAAQVEWIHHGAGARSDAIEMSVMAHHVEVTDDVETAMEALAAETGTSPEEVDRSPHVYMGSVEAIAEEILRNREDYGISYIVFPGKDLEAVAPVVGRLAGK